MTEKITVGSVTTGGDKPRTPSEAAPQASLTLEQQTALELAAVELELKRFQLAEYRKKQEAEETLARQAKAQADSMAKETINRIAIDERNQRQCSHRNANGDPDTATHRDYDGKYITMCQLCFKVWNQAQDPANFRFDLIKPTSKGGYIGGYGSE